MGRSRYKIYEPTHPHFLTCTILHWLPLFINKESVQIIIDSLTHLQEKIAYIPHSPVKRGYIEEAEHWRYSSARDYARVDGLLKVERLW